VSSTAREPPPQEPNALTERRRRSQRDVPERHGGVNQSDAQRRRAGCIAFSPLAQGLLTDRYLNGVPAGSRVATGGAMGRDMLTEDRLARVRALNEVAARRGQSLAQLALVWALRDPRMTSLVIGASSVAQLEDNVAALDRLDLTADELTEIDRHAADADVNLWSRSSSA
jgi:L-glyceraldehyde 3-phosphate reductase